MSNLINAKELLEQGGDLLKQPDVLGLFSPLTSGVGGLPNRNNEAKKKIEESIKNQENKAALKENISFLQNWNQELLEEIEAKAKILKHLQNNQEWI